jgi:protein-glutamine gamma-glutamyltransferase
MELKNLLSVVTAGLTAMGAMLFAMGSQRPWLAMTLWLAAVVSLVVTDFLDAFHLPRSAASLIMWAVLLIFMPEFLLQYSWDDRLRSISSVLIVLQMTLLFQDKDPRVYGWLAVMSLLQAIVAARYNQGVVFGLLLIVYSICGIFGLSLLVLYSQWRKYHGPQEPRNRPAPPQASPAGRISRWPLAARSTRFTSDPSGSSRSGVVAELFARLALVGLAVLLLAGIIFYAAPRYRLSAWRGDSSQVLSTVGFNDQITLGGLGTTIESRQEVMQLKLFDKATREVYPLRDEEVYLRGSAVRWYSQGNWRREAPPHMTEGPNAISSGSDTARDGSAHRLGPPVVQQITTEPYLERDDLFYIWPLIEPVQKSMLYSPPTERLARKPSASGEPRGDHFTCEVETSGLFDGRQPELVPASGEVRTRPYLQMPGNPSSLPRLTDLAAQWLRATPGGPNPANHRYDVVRWFEWQLSSSGQFQYSLEGTERDTSIDPIEDFVTNHRRGHCEYFATALALMLRSQGIPARVVLGYRCDEWHADQQYFQVRQLHAHAWVEAFLEERQIPEKYLRSGNPRLWKYGGWLRLDPTPAGEIGTQAADRTTWGAWQRRWHGLQRFWEKYIVDMDRNRQRESVYDPVSRATGNIARKLLDSGWWKAVASGLWASLAASLRSGIMGALYGVAVLIAIVVLPIAAVWWLGRRLVLYWRRLSAGSGKRAAGLRSSVEFYHRFEQLVARLGMVRAAGQTPREFAHAAGRRLAAASGRREFYTQAVQIVDEFYRVRFGRQELDPPAVKALQETLADFTAASQSQITSGPPGSRFA